MRHHSRTDLCGGAASNGRSYRDPSPADIEMCMAATRF